MKTIWSKFNIRWQLTHRNKTIKRKRSVIRLLKLLDLSQLHFRVTNAGLSHQNWFVHCNINCLVTAYVIHKTSFNATVKMYVIRQVKFRIRIYFITSCTFKGYLFARMIPFKSQIIPIGISIRH